MKADPFSREWTLNPFPADSLEWARPWWQEGFLNFEGDIMGSMFAPVIGSLGGGTSGSLFDDILSTGLSIANRVIGTPTAIERVGSNVPAWPTVGGLPLPGIGGKIDLPKKYQVSLMGPDRKKYRRMNACNPRALTRAIRRVKKFEKFAKQSVRISSHVKLRKGARGRKCR